MNHCSQIVVAAARTIKASFRQKNVSLTKIFLICYFVPDTIFRIVLRQKEIWQQSSKKFVTQEFAAKVFLLIFYRQRQQQQ